MWDHRFVEVSVLDGEWIDQLYVDPENLRCGIGSRLVKAAKRERPGGRTRLTLS